MSYQTFMPFCMRINMYQEVNLVGSTWILGCLTVGQYVTKLEMCQVQDIIEADGTSITSSWIIFCGTSSSFVACFLEIRLWAFVVLYTEMPIVLKVFSYKNLKIEFRGSMFDLNSTQVLSIMCKSAIIKINSLFHQNLGTIIECSN